MAGNFTEIDHIKKRRFLNAFADLGGVNRAAEIAKVTKQAHYNWLKSDAEYVAAFEEAKSMAGDMLEDEAFRRAQQKSDLLLIFLLKGAKPDVYKDRTDITSGGKELGILVRQSDAI